MFGISTKEATEALQVCEGDPMFAANLILESIEQRKKAERAKKEKRRRRRLRKQAERARRLYHASKDQLTFREILEQLQKMGFSDQVLQIAFGPGKKEIEKAKRAQQFYLANKERFTFREILHALRKKGCSNQVLQLAFADCPAMDVVAMAELI